MLSCGEREAMVMALHPMLDSAVLPCFHGCPSFLHRHCPSQSPPSPPLDLSLRSQHQSSPWDFFTFPKLQLPATASSRWPSSLSRVSEARTGWFSFYLGCHRSAVSLTLSLECFSSDSDNCPVPSSYRVLPGSIYSFPLVRYYCLLSAGVLHALLCLKVYSQCICGKRCTSRPPTLLASCSLCIISF